MATNIRTYITALTTVLVDIGIVWDVDVNYYVAASLGLHWNVQYAPAPAPTNVTLVRTGATTLQASWIYTGPPTADSFLIQVQTRNNPNAAWVGGALLRGAASVLTLGGTSYTITISNAPSSVEWRVVVTGVVNNINGLSGISPPVGILSIASIRQQVQGEIGPSGSLTLTFPNAPVNGNLLLLLWGYDFDTTYQVYQYITGFTCNVPGPAIWQCSSINYNEDGSESGIDDFQYTGSDPTGTHYYPDGHVETTYSCYQVGNINTTITSPTNQSASGQVPNPPLWDCEINYYSKSGALLVYNQVPGTYTTDKTGTYVAADGSYYVYTCTLEPQTYTTNPNATSCSPNYSSGETAVGGPRDLTFSGPFAQSQIQKFNPTTYVSTPGQSSNEQFGCGIVIAPVDTTQPGDSTKVIVNLGQPVNDGVVYAVEISSPNAAPSSSAVGSTTTEQPSLELPLGSLFALVGSAIETNTNTISNFNYPAYLAPTVDTAADTTPTGMLVMRFGLQYESDLGQYLRWVYACVYVNGTVSNVNPAVIPPTDGTTLAYVSQAVII